jgi:hypothetical protein
MTASDTLVPTGLKCWSGVVYLDFAGLSFNAIAGRLGISKSGARLIYSRHLESCQNA